MATKYSLKNILEQAIATLHYHEFSFENGSLLVSAKMIYKNSLIIEDGFFLKYTNNEDYELKESEIKEIIAYGETPDKVIKMFSSKILKFQGIEIPVDKSEPFDVEIECL